MDIVLFASKTDAQGNFIGEQGKFNSANPNEIRIDVNAGLNIENEMGSLANYVMLRTFTHEFVHSFEVNADAEYRALKEAVFAEIRRNGKENVENLILIEQEKGGKNEDGSYKLSYDDASHEVLAQSLVDVLPQSTFIETLATQHRNIFEKLYAALKRFMRTIRHRFEQMTSAIPSEAAALKRDVDGAMQYAQHIVDLFDKAALAAVETVQSNGTEAAQTNEATDQQTNENPTGKVRYQARPSATDPSKLDPRTVTRKDVEKLLSNANAGSYHDRTYVPVRISTPGIVQERLNAKNLPMVMPVAKIKQAMKVDTGPQKGSNVRGHGFSASDIADIMEAMDSPRFVFSQPDGRGAIVIRTKRHGDSTAILVEFGDHINQEYTNGYEGGEYNVTVTTFNVDNGDLGLLEHAMKHGWSVVFDKKKEGDPAKKFPATRPFAIEQNTLNQTIPQPAPSVNPERSQRRENADRILPTEYAPVFYSKMAKVIEGMKQEKFGASSVVNTFRGKGVTSEEIKWSGIEAWLEGKKSVTKAELLEFIAGSALQIDEEVLTDEQTPYSEEQQRTLNNYNAQKETAVNELAEAWREQFGEELPTRHEYYDFVRRRIEKANEENAKASVEYKRYKDAERALRKVVDDNDYFGFDSLSEAMSVIRSDDGTFADYYEMSAEESDAFTRYFADREAYWNVPTFISDGESRSLYQLAESVDEIGRDIDRFKREHEKESNHRKTKWGEYKIHGGTNYREVLFKIPNSTYWNDSTLMHWESRLGVFAHARVQDLNTAEGTMLFIEEIQSDWHNEGRKKGYETDRTSAAMIEERETLYKRQEDIRKELRTANKDYDVFLDDYWGSDMSDEEYQRTAERIMEKQQRLKNSSDALDQQIAELTRKIKEFVPDAPFRENYQEYVLKRLIREAAEKGYDSIGWTTADIQSRRWDSKYEEGYRIEYDQDIPKFLNKYGKKWGTKVERTTLDNGTEIWTMPVTESMKYSVLYEGQSRYQRRENLTDRAVLERVDEIVGAVSDRGTVTGDTHGLEVDEVAAFKGKLTDGERDLLAIYTDRLAKLNDLQEQRREQGRIYRRFMADPNPNNRDRGEAAATKNRMDILDQQIDRAMNSLREVERAKAYKSLLTKSRELVQQTERGRILTALQLSREKRERSGQRRQRKDSIEAIKKVYSMSPEAEEMWEHELKHYADCIAKIGMMLS